MPICHAFVIRTAPSEACIAHKPLLETLRTKIESFVESKSSVVNPNAIEKIEILDGDALPDDVLIDASKLFSETYSIWGPLAGAKRGQRIKTSPARLKRECLPAQVGLTCVYARALLVSVPIGHAIACRWQCENHTICWVTQLVVHPRHRSQGLATRLLSSLRHLDDTIYGLASTHAHACMAAAKAFAGAY